MDIHVDVISAIYNFQLKTLLEKRPGDLNPEEVIECMNSGMTTVHKKYELLSDEYLKLSDMYSEAAQLVFELNRLLLDRRSSMRIYDLFLANHGLDEEFENFYARILRRKYRDEVWNEDN